ncbi:TPA: hypothetical protein SU420_001141, partial [Streptococcus equi subsp. equi]|nr:hypothetical protein [Streptococcus equi subsp. equi]
YYLRKSAFGLASVFCTLLVGTASVSAQVTMRGQKYATKAEATARLTTLKQQHPELASTIAGFESKINDSNLIQVDDINKILAEAEQTIAVKAEAERSKRAEEEAANEALRKEKSTVIYIFGSKQGMTLPQELLDVAKMSELQLVSGDLLVGHVTQMMVKLNLQRAIQHQVMEILL